MAKQIIGLGSVADDGTGSSLRAGGDIINDNFSEIYNEIGDGGTLGLSSKTITFSNKTLTTEANTITSGGNTVCSLQQVYPVGSIYINASVSTNPGTLLGFGTWTAFGAGRVPIGINDSDSDFDTAEETGGSKTHTLTEAELPSHYHLSGYGRDDTPRYGTTTGESNVRIDNDGNAFFSTSAAHTSSVGNGTAHNNLQPYIVVYMWKRTA